METPNTLTCISCGAAMEDIHSDQPSGGTCFHTRGHYGSRITDHMDGTITVVFICDDCVELALEDGRAKVYEAT